MANFYGDSNDSKTKPGVTGDTTPLPPEVTSTLDDGLHLLLGPEMVDIHGDTMRYLHIFTYVMDIIYIYIYIYIIHIYII